MSMRSPWCERTESRLIEMVQNDHTIWEIAREISLPIDLIHQRLEHLRLTEDGSGHAHRPRHSL